MSKKLISLVMVAALVVLSAPALGQIIYGKPASGKLRLVYTSWTEKIDGQERTLGQLVMPISTYIPLRENLEGRLYIAGVSNSLDEPGATRGLKGLTDVRIQINKSMMEDHLLFSLGANLPTGKTGLDFDEELAVMKYLSRDYLSYPNRRLGHGLGVNLMVGGATVAGEFRLGCSALFHYTGEYEAYEDNSKYNPGDYFSLNAGAQRVQGRALLMGDLTFTTYGDDMQDGLKAFSRGNQFTFRIGTVFKASNFRLKGNARYYIRDRYTIYDATETVLSQLRVYGNEFAFASSISWISSDKKWSLGPHFDLRFIDANEVELGDANTVGVGGQIERWLTSAFNLSVALKYFTGSADGGAIDLTGYQISASLGGIF